jgi:hypothetical protein
MRKYVIYIRISMRASYHSIFSSKVTAVNTPIVMM